MGNRLKRMAETEGFETVMEMLEAAVTDSLVTAICTDCSEACGGQSVKSCLVIAGLML
jgi:hypothetical protein